MAWMKVEILGHVSAASGELCWNCNSRHISCGSREVSILFIFCCGHLSSWVKSYRNSATGWKGLIQGQAVVRTSWFVKRSRCATDGALLSDRSPISGKTFKQWSSEVVNSKGFFCPTQLAERTQRANVVQGRSRLLLHAQAQRPKSCVSGGRCSSLRT